MVTLLRRTSDHLTPALSWEEREEEQGTRA